MTKNLRMKKWSLLAVACLTVFVLGCSGSAGAATFTPVPQSPVDAQKQVDQMYSEGVQSNNPTVSNPDFGAAQVILLQQQVNLLQKQNTELKVIEQQLAQAQMGQKQGK